MRGAARLERFVSTIKRQVYGRRGAYKIKGHTLGCGNGRCTMARISVVEGLRGIASISVALFHFSGGMSSTVAVVFQSIGWHGVDVFFVISGFVIPLSLYGRDYKIGDFPLDMIRRHVRLANRRRPK